MSRQLAVLFFVFLSSLVAVSGSSGELDFSEIAKRVSSDLGPVDSFGYSIAVDGDTMVVGALNANGPPSISGAAYVFARNQGGSDSWQEVAKLIASDAGSNDDFGVSVDIWGDFVVVGARDSGQGGDRRGAAYVFERNTGGADAWGEVAKLVASDAADVDNFGDAVGIHGDLVVVGSPNANAPVSDTGAAYVYGRNVGGVDAWGQIAKLPGPSGYSYFGNAVAIEGDTIAIGSEHNGTVYIHRQNVGGPDAWGEVAVVTGSSSSTHRFGSSVSISGDTLATGGRSITEPGAAWVFDRNSGGSENWGEVRRITASDGTAVDSFGSAVSIDGDRLVVGARQADTTGTDAGSAYVFERNQGGADNWGETQQIIPHDPIDYANYGGSVAIDGAIIAVGSHSSGGGAAYIFAACGGGSGGWRDGIEVFAADAAAYDFFGTSVSLSGSTMIVGANGDDGPGIYTGAAYVFERNSGGADTWGQVVKLTASDAVGDDRFGVSVDISGDTAVVGAFNHPAVGLNSGAAYVYQRNLGGSNSWGEVVKLVPSDAAIHDRFGEWVAIDGDTIVVGAPYDSDAGSGTGSAYVFARNAGGADNWGEVTKLVASDAQSSSFFGQSVDVAGDVVSVGAPQAPTAFGTTGAVYLFSRDLGGPDNWGQLTKVAADDGSPADFFGVSVSFDGATLLVGAHYDDDLGEDAGSAYVFDRDLGGVDAWGQVAKLLAPDGATWDAFGFRVGLFDGQAVVGAYGAASYSGASYVYERNTGGTDQWGLLARLSAWDAPGGSFARAVAIQGDIIVVGAQGDSDMGSGAGSAYLFNRVCLAFDFGDASDPMFPTLAASDGARHILGGTLLMGATVDAEPDGQPTAAADGDDTDPEGDDEDGVSIIDPIINGQNVGIDVTVSESCLLNAWIDFDDDGDWDDAGEQIFSEEPLTAGSNSMTFPVPTDAAAGEEVTARFRISSVSGLTYSGQAPDGEVEDYEFFIENIDFGDAPDPLYPTVLASDGARHIVDGSLFLGSLVDAEWDGLASPNADGDDTDNLDDEDGISFITWLVAGQTCTIRVTASAAGVVNAWIDYNADGDWADAGEQVFTDVAVVAGQNDLEYAIPLTAATGVDTFARFRLNSAGGLSFDGLAFDGEVEDYHVMIEALDYGDAPDPTYPTLQASDGARHIIVSGFHLGAAVDFEGDGQPTAAADGDDTGGADDEDGVVFTSGLGRGLAASLEVTASATGLLSAWIDFNADGDWDDAGEQVFSDESLAAGVNPLSLQVPVTAALGSTYARFRFSLTPGLDPYGYATQGEVEDYVVEIVEGPDLEIEMVASTEPAPSGRPLSYTITVTNNGPLPATSVVVTDALPGQLIFVSSTPGAPDCTLAGGTLTCDLGSLAPTDNAVVTIETMVDYPEYGGFNNSCSVTAAELDPIQANNTAAVDTIIALFVDGFESGDTTGWD